MIDRLLLSSLFQSLQNMPAVALLGPRQVGKTTLAHEIEKTSAKPTHYLDLELSSDLSKLQDAEAYLRRFQNCLIIIDEIQRLPTLFSLLRALIDIRIRAGETTGQFLLLGSASPQLLQQSSESLAGRIRYLELSPFSVPEVCLDNTSSISIEKIWLRGGFPRSYLAKTDRLSQQWREDFLRTYIEKDLLFMGANFSAVTMRRLWSMLAYENAQQVSFSKLGLSLGVSYKTVQKYLNILTDSYMVRQIQPWSGNLRKRLVKSPKLYIRDSGLTHQLLNVPDIDSLLGHPAVGASWEAFVLENILNSLSETRRCSYFRSAAGSEIDLVIEGPHPEVWAIEIKRSLSLSASKGYHIACEDIQATQKFIVYPGSERYPTSGETEVIGLVEFLQMMRHKFQ